MARPTDEVQRLLCRVDPAHFRMGEKKMQFRFSTETGFRNFGRLHGSMYFWMIQEMRRSYDPFSADAGTGYKALENAVCTILDRLSEERVVELYTGWKLAQQKEAGNAAQ